MGLRFPVTMIVKLTKPKKCITGRDSPKSNLPSRAPDFSNYGLWVGLALQEVNSQLNPRIREHPQVSARELAADIVSDFFAQAKDEISPGRPLKYFKIFAKRRAIDVCRNINSGKEQFYVRWPATSELSHQDWLEGQAAICGGASHPRALREDVDLIFSRTCAQARLKEWQIPIVRAVMTEESTVTEAAEKFALKLSTVRGWTKRVQDAAARVGDRF